MLILFLTAYEKSPHSNDREIKQITCVCNIGSFEHYPPNGEKAPKTIMLL